VEYSYCVIVVAHNCRVLCVPEEGKMASDDSYKYYIYKTPCSCNGIEGCPNYHFLYIFLFVFTMHAN